MINKLQSERGHRRPHLLAVAKQAFFERGYRGTTIAQVAQQAGFSKRTVYLYFKNKDDLFIAVAEVGLVILREQLEELPLAEMSIEQSIEAISDVYLKFARKHPNYFRIIFQEATARMIDNISTELRERVVDHEQACLGVVVKMVESAIAQGMVPPIDPWETAVIFWGMATGIILLSVGGSQTVATRKIREELMMKAAWLLYEGLKHPPKQLPKNNRQNLRRKRLIR